MTAAQHTDAYRYALADIYGRLMRRFGYENFIRRLRTGPDGFLQRAAHARAAQP